MPFQKLNLGLLGCGPIAQFAHLPAIERSSLVELAAVCDGAADLLDTVADRYAIEKRYSCHEDLFGDSKIEAVIIAVSDPFHVPLCLAALRAGKHVLVEKPLGCSSEECEQLIPILEESGLKLQVGSMKRHDPGIEFARRFIKDNIGDVLSVSGWYCDTLFRPQMQRALLPKVIESTSAIKPDRDPKNDREKYSLVTHGAHLLDNLLYLGGPIKNLTAECAEKFGQHTWHGLLEFAHGGLGHFELSVKVNADWSEGYTVYGENGSVHVNTFLPFYQRSSTVKAFDAGTEQWFQPLGADSNPYKRQLEAFVRAIRQDYPTNPDVHDGLATVRLLEAVEESVQTNGKVAVSGSDFKDKP